MDAREAALLTYNTHLTLIFQMQEMINSQVETMERNYHARPDHPDSECVAYYSSLATFKEMKHQLSEMKHAAELELKYSMEKVAIHESQRLAEDRNQRNNNSRQSASDRYVQSGQATDSVRPETRGVSLDQVRVGSDVNTEHEGSYIVGTNPSKSM
jgi:hypothetical protein